MGATTAVGTQAAENQTDDSGELAPGVSENGSVNTTELYQAHSEGLLEEGYQTSETVDIQLNDSEFLTAETETEGSVDNQNVSATTNLTIIGLDYDISKWSNESQTVVRIVKDDNVTYKVMRHGPPEFAGPPDDRRGEGRNGPPTDRGPGMRDGQRGPHMNGGPQGPHMGDGMQGPQMRDGMQGPQMGDGMDQGMGMQMGMGMHHGMGHGGMAVPGHAVLFLDKITENFTVESETIVDDNRTAYELSAPVNISEDAEGNFTGEVTLLVDEEGIVHNVDVNVDSDVYGAETDYTFQLEELGVESVEQPDWVEDVPENATTYGPPEEQPGGGPAAGDETDTPTETETGTETETEVGTETGTETPITP